jgi:hypothetical protein
MLATPDQFAAGVDDRLQRLVRRRLSAFADRPALGHEQSMEDRGRLQNILEPLLIPIGIEAKLLQLAVTRARGCRLAGSSAIVVSSTGLRHGGPLLRARPKWRCRHSAAKKREEVAPSHESPPTGAQPTISSSTGCVVRHSKNRPPTVTMGQNR